MEGVCGLVAMAVEDMCSGSDAFDGSESVRLPMARSIERVLRAKPGISPRCAGDGEL